MKSNVNLTILLHIAILSLAFTTVGLLTGWTSAGQWLLQAGLIWGVVWKQTLQRLDLNRPHLNAPYYKTFGLANNLTMLRGGLIAMTGGFLFQPQATGFIAWLPGLFYGIAAILDRVDGFVARKLKQTSLLGAELDMLIDAMGLLIAPLVAVLYGKIHWSYLSLSIAYYVYQWLLGLRRNRGLPIYPILPSQLRRALAGFQMGFIALVLLPIFPSTLTVFYGFVFMIPVLMGFIFDWFVATGRIQTSNPTHSNFLSTFIKCSQLILLPLLRLLTVWIVLALCKDIALNNHDGLLCSLLIIGTIMVLLGIAGRCGALLILLFASWNFDQSQSPTYYLLQWSSAWIMLFGTGKFNFWRGDDQWINRHDGA